MTYINNAYAHSSFLSTLYENNVDIGLYTYSNFVGASAKTQVSNYIPSKLSLKYFTTVKYLAKMVLYRDMPYLVKARFYYDASQINNNVTSSIRIQNAVASAQEASAVPEFRNFDDEWFDHTLIDKKISLIDNTCCFRFYHLGSCHLNLTNPEPLGIRSLQIVYDYLTQMKELGIYEDSTIIITADHGNSGGGETLDLPQKTAVPLFIVKPTGVCNSPIEFSDAPVSHTDFIPTVLEGFAFDYSEAGLSVFDISETEQRDRHYYYSALYSDEEGEVELREYNVDGDARDSDNYHFTGNRWDILYSENIVAR